jgi:hypothetical protein
LTGLLLSSAAADTIFNSGNPDGRLAAASRPPGGGALEIESADDFLLTTPTRITGATFTGLLPIDSSLAGISQVVLSIYRVFPNDSTVPPDNRVPTRTNSPSDVEILSRDSAVSGELLFTATLVNAQFSAANSILNGINPKPNQTTNGEGPVRGEEVIFTLTFNTPIDLGPDHYFFVPQVQLANGNFYWLSSPKPISGQFAFTPDLQSWIRNADLDPDWLRMGTDIIGGTTPPTFNMAFSLEGTSVPEPSTIGFVLIGLGMFAFRRLRKA